MKILAIETSHRLGSLALLEGKQVVRQIELPADQRTSQRITPAIKQALDGANWRPTDIDLVTTSLGPGSFTGLRLGVTTAKTFAYACGCQVVGLNSLDVIAAQAPIDAAKLSVVIDAQRQEFYAATFSHGNSSQTNGQWTLVTPTQIISREGWLESLDSDTLVTGTGLARCVDILAGEIRNCEETQWTPRAETVGRLGFARQQAGTLDDLWSLAPQYYRLSAAEEKHASRDAPS